MRVEEIMTSSPETCRADDNAATAVALLWNADCGVLPVTDHAGRVAGVVTDRDICIALGTRNARPSELRVENIMRTDVRTCEPTEDVLSVLARMADARVRRVPVVDTGNRLLGVLSMNDIVLAAGPGAQAVRSGAVLDALKAICAHPLPVTNSGADAAAASRDAQPVRLTAPVRT